MKYQNQFSEKNKKDTSKFHLVKFLPNMQSVKLSKVHILCV